MNLVQLEIHVNLHCLRPGFVNNELYYIIAQDEETFRFAPWDELPASGEQKFYCFLTGRKLFIPAGNITLTKSYALTKDAGYPLLENDNDFIGIIDTLGSDGVAKGIRRFSDDYIDDIKKNLQRKYGNIEKHVITSNEAQHMLLVLDHAEISFSSTMVYFRPKAPFSEGHYKDAKG